MEFVKISGEVTDVTIPEGNCVKIEEAETGRVLWEKSLNFTPEWKIYNAQDFSHNGVIGINTIHLMEGTSGSIYKILSLGMTNSANDNASTISRRPVFQKVSDHYSLVAGSSDATAGKLLSVSNGYNFGVAVLCLKDSTGTKYLIGHDNDYSYSYGTIMTSINAPVEESKVKIIYAPEREGYLVTGISGGIFTLFKNFNSSTTINYSGKNAVNGIWVSELGKYFASVKTNTNVGRILSSEDGEEWTEMTFNITKMKGILSFCWLDNLKKLCAVSDTTAKIAISSDGETWELKDVPFTNALCCTYSPAQKLFCVLEKTCAYITRDLAKWIEAPLPDKTTFNFKEVIHVVDGIFACHEYLSDKLCILTTRYPIR